MKHTPGPWFELSDGHASIAISNTVGPQWASKKNFIAHVTPSNAALIAAAPELLEACKYAAELVKTARKYFPKSIKNSDRFSLENTCATINKAIARAEGREP